MSEIKAGIVLVSQFVVSTDKKFSEYIDYIDRSEAKRGENIDKFSLFNDYMDNPEKSTGIFTEELDALDKEQKANLKDLFTKAQENGSLMWQHVISFDNRWLKQQGVLTDDVLNEDVMRKVAREAMTAKAKTEKMSASMVWSAAIHYNTGNTHIHIAAVEPIPTRERGKLKPNSLNSMKSKTYSAILDRSEIYKEMTDIVRQRLVKSPHKASEDKELRDQFLKIHAMLPKDKRLWKYNMSALKPLHPEINKLTDMMVQKYHKKDFAEFNRTLDVEQANIKEAFGEGEKRLHEQFRANKMKDFYARKGNAILNEIRQYDYEINKPQTTPNDKIKARLRRPNISTLCRRAMKKSFESLKNQMDYDNLQKQIEKQNQMPTKEMEEY